MTSWPKRWSLKQRVLLRAGQQLIDFACSLPRAQRGPLAHLQLEGEHQSADRDHDNTVMPSGVDLQLLNVVYCDLVLVEDFPRLASGLAELSAQFPSWMRWRNEPSELGRWVEASGHGPQGVSWYNVGFLDFTKGPAEDAPRWADYAQIRLIRFAPSAIAVAIVVSPSDLFAARLQRLFRSQARERRLLRWLRWRPLSFGFAAHPAWRVRLDEMEDALLDLQRQVIGLVASYARVGIAAGGPLPSLEVYVADQGEVGTADGAGAETAKKRERAFWHSLGMPKGYPFAYRHTWLALRPVDDLPEDRLSTVWRALIDRKAFLRDTERTIGFADEKHKMTYLVSERLGLLAPMLACREYADRLLTQISSLRSELAPVLAGRGRLRLGHRGFGSALGRMVRIENLDFVVRRVKKEFDYGRLASLFEREGMPGLVIDVPDWQRPTALVTHMRSHLERVQEHASAQLSLLKGNYSAIVRYEQVRSEWATQHRLSCLTVILVILTTVIAVLTWEIVPADTRAYLLSLVRHPK